MRSVLIPAVTILALAGCSSGHKQGGSTTSTTSSTLAPTTTTSVEPASTTAPTTTSTTVPAGPTTTTPVTTKVFGDFEISPASPVSCNAPTSIELSWTALGVSAVALSIDGQPFATFGGGHQDHLEYFACDGKKHTYTLSAKVGTKSVTVSADVTSKTSG